METVGVEQSFLEENASNMPALEDTQTTSAPQSAGRMTGFNGALDKCFIDVCASSKACAQAASKAMQHDISKERGGAIGAQVKVFQDLVTAAEVIGEYFLPTERANNYYDSLRETLRQPASQRIIIAMPNEWPRVLGVRVFVDPINPASPCLDFAALQAIGMSSAPMHWYEVLVGLNRFAQVVAIEASDMASAKQIETNIRALQTERVSAEREFEADSSEKSSMMVGLIQPLLLGVKEISSDFKSKNAKISNISEALSYLKDSGAFERAVSHFPARQRDMIQKLKGPLLGPMVTNMFEGLGEDPVERAESVERVETELSVPSESVDVESQTQQPTQSPVTRVPRKQRKGKLQQSKSTKSQNEAPEVSSAAYEIQPDVSETKEGESISLDVSEGVNLDSDAKHDQISEDQTSSKTFDQSETPPPSPPSVPSSTKGAKKQFNPSSIPDFGAIATMFKDMPPEKMAKLFQQMTQELSQQQGV